jgi:hypothetical protein
MYVQCTNMARRVLFISLWLPEQPDNTLSRTDRRYGYIYSPATIKITYFFKYPIFLRDFQHISIISNDFHKVPCIKLHGNLSGGSHADTFGQTDTYVEANLPFSPLRERAYKQDRQCTYKVTLRRVRVTMLP